ncbi:NAD-dependent epimerase/dehydratase family protein [Rubrivirga sp. S365]|uniref:NAD-dependent epimerase/dehydratase family protein n=1 Tax=Rubrivirga litoralis TaxID=3075598 RepID=A0ABU3BSN8_9BACT|nr:MULTISPECIES: NAD-dependent epimerase/dehydratase family protein [unclassified Rubrivirga]MDT0632304.1 NAD-dependent epimerase/dehydratase family protein [Rubrivirga sp. F394]MDT7856311.1 NAD-dependent epimerase/dehydratase family protein [Rubrivirga sp. S365]
MPSRLAFVTGGTGFVGSWVVEELLGRGYAVRALVRSDPKWLAEYDVETIRGDLGDADALRAGVAGADLVVHVAGLTRARDQAMLDRANVDGTLALLDAVRERGGVAAEAPHAARAGRVLVTSSLEAMGPNAVRPDGTPVPATEADSPRPISMYGRSKARMEAAVRERYGDLDVTVVRPPAVYGPRETDIYEMIKGSSRGLFPVVGRGDVPRLSLVHVRDLARGMVDLVEAPVAAGETYFVGGPAYAWDEVRRAVEGALGRRTLRLPVPAALVGGAGALAERVGGLVGRLPPLTRDKAVAARYAWTCSSAKAGRAVGYVPRVPLGEGLAETVAWYRRAGWL